MNPTVQEIVKEYLTTHGYDGLYNEDCGCQINNLSPCGDDIIFCRAGCKTMITEENQRYYPDCEVGDCILSEGRNET